MYDIQVVVRFSKLAALQKHLGNFLNGDMIIGPVYSLVIGTAGDGEVLVLLHAALDGVEILAVRMTCGDKQIGFFIPNGLLASKTDCCLDGK